MKFRNVASRLAGLVPVLSQLKRQRDVLAAEQLEFFRKVISKIVADSRAGVPPQDSLLEPRDLLGYQVDTVAKIEAVAENIQGWFGKDGGLLLYFLVCERIPVPIVVELGSWKGRSTIWLASAMRERGDGRVFAVDTWPDASHDSIYEPLLHGYKGSQLFDEFQQNVREAGLEQFVEPIRRTTIDTARSWPKERQIGLLLIDADHSYEAVKQEFDVWIPFLAEGGYVVFDDVPGWVGPTKFVLELLLEPCTFLKIAGASQNQIALRKVRL